jgi:hypothetical protein
LNADRLSSPSGFKANFEKAFKDHVRPWGYKDGDSVRGWTINSGSYLKQYFTQVDPKLVFTDSEADDLYNKVKTVDGKSGFTLDEMDKIADAILWLIKP